MLTGVIVRPAFWSLAVSLAASARRLATGTYGRKANQLTVRSSWSGFDGALQIQRDELQQFVVAHLRQQSFTASVEELTGQVGLVLDHLIDAFFNRTTTDEFVNQDVALLTDP